MKILQITAAAPGWYAAFKLSDGTRIDEPVPLWAIVEYDNNDDPSQTLQVEALLPIAESTSLLPALWPMEGRRGFIGYYHETEEKPVPITF